MPLSKTHVAKIVDIVLHAQVVENPETVRVDRLRDELEAYFKQFVVILWGAGDITSCADEMEFVLADDEIEEIIAELQNGHDADRGVSNATIEQLVERYYEDSQDKNRELCPDFWIIRVDETRHWKEDWRKEHGNPTMYGVYLIDRRERTFLCETTPSYAAYYIEQAWTWEDPEFMIEDFDQEVREADASEPVSYFHCREVDPVLNALESKDAKEWRPDRLTTDMYADEATYGELVEEMMQAYRESPVW